MALTMEDLKELTDITSSYSILYVEDDRDTASLVIEFLSQIFKEVVYAENGSEALALYKQMNFELILADINMPIMSGLDLSAEIKKIKKDQTIIVISGYTDIKLFISSIQLGIDGYVIKPINYTDMYNLFYKLAKKIQILKKMKNMKNKQRNILKK